MFEIDDFEIQDDEIINLFCECDELDKDLENHCRVKYELEADDDIDNIFPLSEISILSWSDLKADQSLFGREPTSVDSADVKPIIRETIPKDKQQHKCEDCGQVFLCRSKLILHSRRHTGDKPFECDTCGKCFPSQSSLIVHGITHSGQKCFRCKICGKHFSSRSTLKVHRITHGTGPKPIVDPTKDADDYPCDVCEKQYNEMQRKCRTLYNDDKSLMCETCGMWFLTRTIFNRHKLTHLGKRIQCDVCLKYFAHSSSLVAHKRIHTGEKPYGCELCGKRFRQPSGLNFHRKSHTGERPFKCDECPKGFITRGDLNTHQRIHTGEHPYECDICGVLFKHRASLIAHKKKHAGEKFTCDVCGNVYAQQSTLIKHKKSHQTAN